MKLISNVSFKSLRSATSKIKMPEEQKKEWRQIFDSLCKENAYELDKEGVRSVFAIVNSNRKANGQDAIVVGDEVFENIFAEVDVDDSGLVDFEEFLGFVQKAEAGKIAGFLRNSMLLLTI